MIFQFQLTRRFRTSFLIHGKIRDCNEINHALSRHFQTLLRTKITRWIFFFQLKISPWRIFDGIFFLCHHNSWLFSWFQAFQSYFQKYGGKDLLQRLCTRPLPNIVTNQGQIRIQDVKRLNLRYPRLVCLKFDSTYWLLMAWPHKREIHENILDRNSFLTLKYLK